MNLYSYVDHPFSDKATFNFEKFKEHARLALRMMDDILDLELEKIDRILAKIDSDPEPEELKRTEKQLWQKIRKKCLEGRRTGIGITAEGDMLAALGLQYGSDKSIDFSVQVHKTLALSVYRSSITLAKERGAFEIYDPVREVHNPFIQRLREADHQLCEDMLEYGRRNISLLTIAPTGTTSLMTQTSSGIEPVFKVAYKRRKKVNPNDANVGECFQDDEGQYWMEYKVLHPKFEEWLRINGINREVIDVMDDYEFEDFLSTSPYHNSTAEEIDWVQKVKLQGAVQKWVDHSISVTVNLPNSATEKDVEDIYTAAWRNGCKGVTVYRDGSRSGVLVSNEDRLNKHVFEENHSPKRPKVLDAEVVRFKNKHENWIAVVGLLEGKPYEIFTGRAEDTFVLPKELKHCMVKKVKQEDGKNRYDLQYWDDEGELVTHKNLSQSFEKEFWNYAKLISGILRHGMPLPYAVELIGNLHLDNQQINTWTHGVCRALRKFIPNGTTVAKKVCQECGDPEGLVFMEGCLICRSCGNSKC